MKISILEISNTEKNFVKWIRILLFLILLTVAFNILFLMRYNFQDDAAFYVTLAQEQLRTHSLFPEGMHYSSGLFVLTPNLLIVPFLLLTDNLVLARQLAILLLWLFLYILLYKVFVINSEKNISGFILASSFFSILYVNSSVVSMHFYQGAYVGYLLFTLSFLALMSKIIGDNCYNNKFFAGVLILYVLANLGDIRNLIIWGIPGLLAFLFFNFLETGKNIELFLKKETEKKFARILLNGVMLAFIAFAFMAKMYGNYGSTASMIELASKDYGQSLSYILLGMFNLFGNSYTARVFSGAGFFKLINFIVAILFNFVVPVVSIKKLPSIKSQSTKFLLVFSLTSTFFYLFVVFITGATICLDRYLVPIYNNNILLFALVCSLFLKQGIIKKYRLASIVIFSVLIYVFSSNLFYLYSQKDSLIYHKNGYFASGEEGVVDFLESKGLQYGYATFNNAEEYSVLSNNKVRVRSVAFEKGTIFPIKWLTSDSFYKPDYYIGDTFLMITDDELKRDFPEGPTVLGKPKAVFKFKKYHVYVYGYNISNKFAKSMRCIWLLRGEKSNIWIVDDDKEDN